MEYKKAAKKILEETNQYKTITKMVFEFFISLSLFFTAMSARLDHWGFLSNKQTVIAGVIASIMLVLSSKYFGMYSTPLRHFSIHNFKPLLKALLVTILSLFVAKALFFSDLPRSVPFIFASFFLLFYFIYLSFFGRRLQSLLYAEKKSVVIYGAGNLGTRLANLISSEPNYSLLYFIDDSPIKQKQQFFGVKVLSFYQAVGHLEKVNINTLVMAVPNPTPLLLNRAKNLCEKNGIDYRTPSNLVELLLDNQKTEVKQQFNVSDLLNRTIASPIKELMNKNIRGRNVLVTGAGGSIGSEICNQILLSSPNILVIFDISEAALFNTEFALKSSPLPTKTKLISIVGSVLDMEQLKQIVNKYNIETVYHAAAYKHVSLMEANPLQCFKNNFVGTRNLLHTCCAENVKNFTLVSTDKAVNPTSLMGASKRLAELECQTVHEKSSNTVVSIVRFGNVVGSSGSVIPIFEEQIKNGGPVTVTHKNVERFFMTVQEAAQLVIQANSLALKGEVFVLDMGAPINIFELSKMLIKVNGFTPVLDKPANRLKKEIEIKITGLKIGEKITEELSYSGDLMATKHPKILMDREFFESKRKLSKNLATIARLINQGNAPELLRNVEELLPTLKRSRSKQK